MSAVEGFHDADAREVLAHDAVDLVERALDAAVEGKARTEAGRNEDGDDWHHGHEHQGHGRVEEDRHDDAADCEQRRLDEDPHEAVGEVLYLRDVVREPGDERGLLEAVEVAEGEAVDAAVEVAAERGAEALRDPARDDVPHRRADRTERGDAEHREAEREDDGQVARSDAAVDHPRHDRRLEKVARGLEAQEEDRGDECFRVRLYVRKKEGMLAFAHAFLASYSHLNKAAAAARKTIVMPARIPTSPAI